MKTWEKALLIGFVLCLLLSVPLGAQERVQQKMTRLHIVANSDSDFDQELKMKVRDSVLKVSANCECVDAKLLSEMLAAARKTVNGLYPVSVKRCREWFDTRVYDTFSLPAGIYDSVIITLGEGKGHNFWCVVFPPLCTAASEREFDNSVKKVGLSEKDTAFIKEDGVSYVISFKIAELVGDLFRQ